MSQAGVGKSALSRGDLANPLQCIQCPQCGNRMSERATSEQCTHPQRVGGILEIFQDENRPGASSDVREFYERHPFPGYAPDDDASRLLDRCRTNAFMRALDRAIAPDARVLDCGCGTAQISSFVALTSRRRTVIGADMCLPSLREAEGFQSRAGMSNLQLMRANLFALPLEKGSFDVVICRGVVHHTEDPDRAIGEVADYVKPGGFIVLGIYELVGRFLHRMRTRLSRLRGGRPVRCLDPILRRTDLSEEKKQRWIEDQYHHPLEVSIGVDHAVARLEEAGMTWVRCVPPLSAREDLLEPSARGWGTWSRLQLGWFLSSFRSEDAGLICIVARKGE